MAPSDLSEKPDDKPFVFQRFRHWTEWIERESKKAVYVHEHVHVNVNGDGGNSRSVFSRPAKMMRTSRGQVRMFFVDVDVDVHVDVDGFSTETG